jgi:hypothetical protein
VDLISLFVEKIRKRVDTDRKPEIATKSNSIEMPQIKKNKGLQAVNQNGIDKDSLKKTVNLFFSTYF